VSEPKPDGKSFVISKRLVWEAWRRVKANKGAAGVDEESIEEFERDLQGNLYKLWNRMSSGSYMPPPVRAVEIPKKSGGSRMLGVPTVADRVAQTVAYLYLEPEVEPVFHQDSYATGIGRDGRPTMRCGHAGSDAGVMTGLWIWISSRSWCHRHTANAFMR
jgi:RNA-directed DNA polymerase